MSSTGSVWPAVIGVAGTLAGAVVAATITLWNSRNARIREDAMFKRTQSHAQEDRIRAARALVYEEWLRALRSFMERADADAAAVDVRELVDAVAQILDRLELHASDEVRRAAAEELDLIRTYSATLTERRSLVLRLRDQHENIVVLMRHDLA